RPDRVRRAAGTRRRTLYQRPARARRRNAGGRGRRHRRPERCLGDAHLLRQRPPPLRRVRHRRTFGGRPGGRSAGVTGDHQLKSNEGTRQRVGPVRTQHADGPVRFAVLERGGEAMARVAVLGTGIMGGPMARNLLRAGHGVTVWNRTEQKAQPLEEEGARVASTPVDAVHDAQIVLTMLADAPAVEATIVGSGGLDAMPPGSLWIQSSTIGVAATDRLAELAGERGIV